MRVWLRSCIALLGVVGLSLAVAAQASQAPPPQGPPQAVGYPVTGRVVCADTQRPARFAEVMLLPASTGVSDYDRGRTAVARTDLDGRFSMENVPPGDYYATAQLTGYINEALPVRLALSQGGDALNAISSVPRVQVSAGGASVQLALQRGAAITGTVQWDDGSPAAGVQVAAQPPPTGADRQATGQVNGGFNRPGYGGLGNSGQTDDRGRFRLSGLAPGSYNLRASVQSPTPSGGGAEQGRFQRLVTLNVYAPNKLRRTDAAVITVAAGEDRQDVNVVLGLSGMHTVSGQVSSSSAPVHSGSVQLTDQTDSLLTRRSGIGADGGFTLPYVPPGTYTLRVTASAQMPNPGRGPAPGGSDIAVRFQPVQESVTVTDSDLTGLSVTVTPATPSP